MNKLLVFSDWYFPGYKAGGPIRSAVNFVLHMQPEYNIYVFTRDRDLGSEQPYEGIEADKWIKGKGSEQLFYCSPGKLGWKTIKQQWDFVAPDFVYLNSMFSRFFTIYPLLINRSRSVRRLVLAPRGMLKDTALQFKPAKKSLFLHLFKTLRIQHTISFHAVDETEEQDLRKQFGEPIHVERISNLPGQLSEPAAPPVKLKSELHMIFIARIHPVKNLDYLLKRLMQVKQTVRLLIVGTAEDQAYWNSCKDIIAALPANIEIIYKGEMPNTAVLELMAAQHLLCLPTQGENFGHVIFEALSSGKPVIISDQTPWLHLKAEKAGFDLPLARPELFEQAIEEAAGWDQSEYREWSQGALNFARMHLNAEQTVNQYKKLFS